jgi:hypothetical protein
VTQRPRDEYDEFLDATGALSGLLMRDMYAVGETVLHYVFFPLWRLLGWKIEEGE